MIKSLSFLGQVPTDLIIYAWSPRPHPIGGAISLKLLWIYWRNFLYWHCAWILAHWGRSDPVGSAELDHSILLFIFCSNAHRFVLSWILGHPIQWSIQKLSRWVTNYGHPGRRDPVGGAELDHSHGRASSFWFALLQPHFRRHRMLQGDQLFTCSHKNVTNPQYLAVFYINFCNFSS